MKWCNKITHSVNWNYIYKDAKQKKSIISPQLHMTSQKQNSVFNWLLIICQLGNHLLLNLTKNWIDCNEMVLLFGLFNISHYSSILLIPPPPPQKTTIKCNQRILKQIKCILTQQNVFKLLYPTNSQRLFTIVNYKEVRMFDVFA